MVFSSILQNDGPKPKFFWQKMGTKHPLTQIIPLHSVHVLHCKPGHSGYLIFLGRVIRIIQNSSNKNCYPILVPKSHYLQFRVPDNSGSGIPDLPEFSKNNTVHKFSIAIYI